MNSKYLELLENTLTRYQRSGLLVGDYIKFADNYKSRKGFKDLDDSIKDKIKDVIELNKSQHLRVVAIKNKYPSAQPANEFNTNGHVVVDVGLDYGGGRFYSVLTVPSDVLERIDYGVNLAPLPDALRRDNMITLKPELVEMDAESETYKQTRKTRQGKKDAKSETSLNQKNTKIPADSAYYIKYMS